MAAVLPLAAPLLQQPIFTSRADGVRVDVLVTERGRPVLGLRPSDFEVLDNGVRQKVDLVNVSDVPVSVMLGLDLSGSVGGSQLAALKRASHALLAALAPGDAAGLLTFSTAVVKRAPITSDLARVRKELDIEPIGGDTALIDAALTAILLADADAGRALVVLFSDGVDTASFMPAAAVLDTARRANSVVYGVWSGAGNPDFLEELAAATGGRVVSVGKGGDPRPVFLEILGEFRRRYVLTFAPEGAPPSGWHSLSVRVNRGGARIQTRSGYFAAEP